MGGGLPPNWAINHHVLPPEVTSSIVPICPEDGLDYLKNEAASDMK